MSGVSEEITVGHTGGPWKQARACTNTAVTLREGVSPAASEPAGSAKHSSAGNRAGKALPCPEKNLTYVLGALEISYAVRVSHGLGPGSPPTVKAITQVGACRPRSVGAIFRGLEAEYSRSDSPAYPHDRAKGSEGRLRNGY